MILPAVVGYVPPSSISPKVCNPSAFIENIRKFRTRHELILFSDGNWADCVKIPDPELAVDRNAKLKNGQTNTFALNNLLFLTALRIAAHRGITHLLYVEADCRVGCHEWDGILFDAHFRHPEPVICSGTVVIFNPCNAGRESQNRWMDYITKTNTRRNYPIATYGYGGQSLATGSAIFTNGALGVYDLRWLSKFFADALGPQGKSRALAEASFAWDFAIGFAIWKEFGIHSYDVVAHVPQVFSSFGDVLTTEEERMTMLRNGDCCAVHQVKGSTIL